MEQPPAWTAMSLSGAWATTPLVRRSSCAWLPAAASLLLQSEGQVGGSLGIEGTPPSVPSAWPTAVHSWCTAPHFQLHPPLRASLLQCTSSPTSLPLKPGAWPLRPLLPAATTSCCLRWRAAAATACACWMSTARRRWVPLEFLLLCRAWAGGARCSRCRRRIASSCWAWASQRRLASSPEHCIPLEGAAACGHGWLQACVAARSVRMPQVLAVARMPAALALSAALSLALSTGG